jgi:hypothetical protein
MTELALIVFNNRPVYCMDLTLPTARQLLYTLHEARQLSDVVLLAALFPLYNLPALSSDPISCALLGAIPKHTVSDRPVPGRGCWEDFRERA